MPNVEPVDHRQNVNSLFFVRIKWRDGDALQDVPEEVIAGSVVSSGRLLWKFWRMERRATEGSSYIGGSRICLFVPTGSGPRAATQVYLNAAGAAPVIAAVTASAGPGAVLGVIAVHKAPVPFDLQALMSTEMTVVGSRGYPTEIFEVTDHLIARPEAYRSLISHRFGFDDVLEALRTAATPGAADKVVVTF